MKPWFERIKSGILAWRKHCKEVGENTAGFCQRGMRIACLMAHTPWPGAPEEKGVDTALDAHRDMVLHPERYPGWVEDHDIGTKPGAWACFLVPGGKTSTGEEAGHICLLIVSKLQRGDLQKWVYDNNGVHAWTQKKYANRLHAAYTYRGA